MSSCITGWGSADSHAHILNDGRDNPHPSAGLPYHTISFQQVYDMLGNPPSVDKDKAQWIIPSTYHENDGRSHSAQREHGDFCWLAADIDSGNPTLSDVCDTVRVVLPGSAFAVYSSRSSTQANKKWRILVPLGQNIPGSQYGTFAAAFFDALQYVGNLDLDRTLERTGQVVYLPNRGEWYEYHVEGGNLLVPLAHQGLASRASDYAQAAQAVRGDAQGKGGPFIGGFVSRNPIATLLAKYGYTQKGNSNHWRSPYQDSNSYGTEDRGDHWLSLSHSDGAKGIGRPTLNGSRYGDAFDLYVHYEHNGDWKAAVATIKRVQYGASSSGVLINHTDDDGEFWDVYPLPNRLEGNGYDIMLGIDYVDGVPFSERAQAHASAQHEAEVKRAHDLHTAAEEAESQRWSGPWVKEVPFKFKPSELEWLAWHAPGVIGQAVRARSPKTARFTLAPLMVGAVMAVSHFGQGKFVSQFRQFHTPTALMMFMVGDSGSGKGDGNSMFYDLLGLVDKTRIKAWRTKTFASGQSLTDYLMHHNSDVMMVQQEGGADRKAGKGSSNFESLIAGVTEAFTSFEHGVEITHTKSDDKDSKSVAHPTVAALMSSTPKKLFGAIDGSDAESGWLGRNLFIKLPLTSTNLLAKETVDYPPEVSRVLNAIVELNPPLTGNNHPDVWQGSMQAFHKLRYTAEAMELMDDMTRYCDEITNDMRRSGSETAIYARATEAVNRLATVCGLAKGGLVIDAECVIWSTRVVKQSLALVTSKMENMVEEEVGDTPASKVRAAVKKYFKLADGDSKFFNSFGTGAMRNSDGEVLLTVSALKRKVKDNTKVSQRVTDEELHGMLGDGEVFLLPGKGLSRWVKYVG